MTPQKIYDTVARALIKQGKASTGSGRCVYRAEDGSRCAVGHLIPDRAYLPGMDESGMSAETLLHVYRWALPSWMPRHLDLLRDLQIAHDRSLTRIDDGVAHWRSHMREVANRYNLDTSVLNEPAQPPAEPVEVEVEVVKPVRELEFA